MSAIDPGAAARQGFLFSPIYIAVQGLIAAMRGGEVLMRMRRTHRR
jgi:hypothetical protein